MSGFFNRLKVRRVLKHIKHEGWRNIILKRLRDADDRNNNFKKFECSSFFRGYHKAAHNKKIYRRRKARIDRQIKFLMSFEDKSNA